MTAANLGSGATDAKSEDAEAQSNSSVSCTTDAPHSRSAAKERLEREWGDRYEQDARALAELYTAKETAENLGVSERTIRRWIEGGRLHAEKAGGEFRIAQEDARAALAGSRAARPVSLDAYVRWLEDENDRLWKLLEKAVSRG